MSNVKPSLWEKIANVQQSLGAIEKSKSNPHFKNSYFDINDLLAALKPHLKANRLLFTQVVESHEGRPVLCSSIRDLDSGESTEAGSALLPDIADPQKFAGAVTYFKRITATALWLVEGEEDDDGNTASRTAPTKRADHSAAVTKLEAAGTMDELQRAWLALSPEAMNDPTVLAAKDRMKAALAIVGTEEIPTIQIDEDADSQ